MMENEFSQESLTSLPDLVLLKILSLIRIQDLLQSVSRTCKKLHDIIENYSRLWRHFSPDHCDLVTKEQLMRILNHSVGFYEFVIPYCSYVCCPPDVDFLFTTGLCNAKLLYWLDITGCEVSTLCFLNFLPNIEILNLSECKNLVDVDFQAIRSCKKLSQCYVSFTKIKPETIVSLCDDVRLSVLDTSGIPIKLTHCRRILSPYLLFFYVTLAEGEDEQMFQGLVRRYRDTCIHLVRRIRNE